MFAQAITNRKLDRAPALAPTPAASTSVDGVTIRRSRPGDGRSLFRLALLDDRRLARGPHLLAERAGEIVGRGAALGWGGDREPVRAQRRSGGAARAAGS